MLISSSSSSDMINNITQVILHTEYIKAAQDLLSSSTDDDIYEYLKRPRPKIQNYIENVVNNYTAREVTTDFDI